MPLTQYLETEIDQIHHDWLLSGSNMDLDIYALAWIEEHAEEFAQEHIRS